MNTTNTFLKFVDKEGNEELVSIDSILEGGNPIDAEDGDDLELVDNGLYRENGVLFSSKFNIGDSVIAAPSGDEFDHEFLGTVKSFDKGFIQVEDQEGNVYDCDESQLSSDLSEE